MALAYLQAKGLRLITRNYKTPSTGGGEVDLIMQESPNSLPWTQRVMRKLTPKQTGQQPAASVAAQPTPTLVFVEVRHRANAQHGGAAASVGRVKQQRIIFAARHYLLRLAEMPPCRFDVVCLEGDLEQAPKITWLPGAFEAPSF